MKIIRDNKIIINFVEYEWEGKMIEIRLKDENKEN